MSYFDHPKSAQISRLDIERIKVQGVEAQLNTVSGQIDGDHLEYSRSPAFLVKFWGVRGNVPISSPYTSQYGGNTPCVELLVSGKRLIFDGGTGLQRLGQALGYDEPVEAHIFFTHTQLDRIQGFPYFRPAFRPGNRFHIYGPQSTNGASIKHALVDQMLRPRSLVPFHKMKADLMFETIVPGQAITVDDIKIETIVLNSLNLALGYRITWNGHVVVYATDTFCTPANEGFRHIAQQADLLIFDAVHSGDAYFDVHHADHLKQSSTWMKSVEQTLTSDIKEAVMFYYDPNHEDGFLSTMEGELQRLYPNVRMAQEGKVLTVG